MRDNTDNKVLYRHYISKWRNLMEEYEQVKKKKHPHFRFVSDFYKYHKTHRQVFLKHYHRYLNEGRTEKSLLPLKPGPRWKARTPFQKLIEEEVVKYRKKGMNRYEICFILNPVLRKRGKRELSPSYVYRILKRKGLSRLKPKMREEKRKIIRERAGELGHIDCHHLSGEVVLAGGKVKRCYMVGLIDDCTRLAWCDVVEDVKSLTVMFSAMRIMSVLEGRYQMRFKEIMSDNGPEFCSKGEKAQLHPFERMLKEMGIKHRYTRPYRPQTNGKVERLWRSMNEDLLEGVVFKSIEELREELEKYLIYYNEHRPHQGLGGQTPAQMNKACERAKK